MKRLFLFLFICCLGCNTVNKGTVLLVDAEDAIMKEWARAHNDGLTTPDVDRKVMVAHAQFNQAKEVAALALRTYDAGGDKSVYIAALEAARAAVDPLLDLLTPYIIPAKLKNYQTTVAIANIQ